jgi:leucyl-tRNA synthetase
VVSTRTSPRSPAEVGGYDHRAIEAKWRRAWAAAGSNDTPLSSAERPFYNLMMFPYPSAEGLHVGNVYAYTGGDVYGRWRRRRGDTVFQPMGFDAFGLHTETHAARAGEHPSRLVPRNAAHFRRQLEQLGAMFDWDRRLDTTDPSFYRWTQWLFLRLLEAGLAERRDGPALWCPSCRTVVDDWQVEHGHCERCGARVEQRSLPQWFLLITRYAQALLDGLDELDWPEPIKTAQRAWIGRSEGAVARFELRGPGPAEVEIFTSRPDTLYGVTHLLVGAEHPRRDQLLRSTAVHPLTGESLPVREEPAPGDPAGVVAAVLERELDRGPSERAARAVAERLARASRGGPAVRYRLRDWLVSRRRYWGPPVPVVTCASDGLLPVPVGDLPVPLPHVEDFRPVGTGVPPLASALDWVATRCPRCGGPARRDTDVLDSSLDAAWYYLRYPSGDLHDRAFGRRRTWTWLPADSYIGGSEHAVGHLLQARFVMRALHDLGLVPEPEPFRRFRAHGVILRDGAKMSKTRGNVVDPDRYMERHGADTLRLYLMFMGRYGTGGDFRDEAIGGMRRFVERVWRAVQRAAGPWQHPGPLVAAERDRRRQRLVAAVDRRIARLAYNTAIAELMRFARALDREAAKGRAERADAVALVSLLAPFAPHLCEELWQRLGQPGSVHDAPWPERPPEPAAGPRVTVPVSVDGRPRARLEVPAGTGAPELERLALALPRIVELLEDRPPSRVVAVPDRIVNLVR